MTQNLLNRSSGYTNSIKLSLICSILALSSWKRITQKVPRFNNELEVINYQPLNFLDDYLSYIHSDTVVQELIIQLLQTFNRNINEKEFRLTQAEMENDRLKQYLRKFNFFYRYYYIKNYPNDLSTLSIKKMNMLAIKSLFFIHSL